MPRPLIPGIYAPTQVFYLDGKDENLDESVIKQHATRLAKAGVAGIVTNGSNGEAVYLTSEERFQVSKWTRQALDGAGFAHLPIIAGASDQSVQGTLRLCYDAAAAGSDAVLVMVPSFFKWAMTNQTIERYFIAVADQSPLPVIIYNYPGAVSGIDLDSDLLIRLSQHTNIVGTKFTCGGVGKLARVTEATETATNLLQPTSEGSYFAFAGVADFISSSIEVGASGAIVGAANVFPRACVNLYNLSIQGKRMEAMEAQKKLAKADWELTKRAIPGFKAILDHWFGYGGIPRAPMPALGKEESNKLFQDIAWMIEIESNLDDYGVPS